MARMLGAPARDGIGSWLLGGSRKRKLKNRIARRREGREVRTELYCMRTDGGPVWTDISEYRQLGG